MTVVEPGPATPASFTEVFAHALRGHPCRVTDWDRHGSALSDRPWRVLPTQEWLRPADADDRGFLAHCRGSTLDIGCGPGRMSAALVDAGGTALGIDVVAEAVDQTRGRGAPAMVLDVFDVLPGEGEWRTCLLADGNVGIGGDPVALLRRTRDLVGRGGRVVVELAAPGIPASTGWAVLECRDLRSRPFRWAVLGTDDLEADATAAGLVVDDLHTHGERWCAVLTPGPDPARG